MEVLRVTQGRDTGAHRGTFALDLGGKNTERDKVYAPCDMRIVRVRTDAGNNGEVYSESIEPVLLPGGGASALHFTFIHADSYKSNVWVGAVLPQGTYFYDEGGKAGGQPGVYAAHLHLEVGRGASPAKQVQNSYGCWMTPNTEPIENLLWLRAGTPLLSTGGYDWKEDKEEGEDMQFYSVFGNKNCQYFATQNTGDVAGTLTSGMNYPMLIDVGLAGGYRWVQIYVAGAAWWAVLLDDRARLINASQYTAEEIANTINDQAPFFGDGAFETVQADLAFARSKLAAIRAVLEG